MFFGTSVYSVIFYGGAMVLVFFVVRYLFKVWTPSIKIDTKAEEKEKSQKVIVASESLESLTRPLIKTIAAIVVVIVVLTLGWNLKNRFTASLSTYQSPAEESEQKAVQGSTLPSREDFDKARQEQKERADLKPQEKAFESFNEGMQQEEEKIRKRSIEK